MAFVGVLVFQALHLTRVCVCVQRNIADTGLNLLLQICESFEHSAYATQFYQAYYLQLMQEIFAVMTGIHCVHMCHLCPSPLL